MAYKAHIDTNRKFGVEIECYGEVLGVVANLFFRLEDKSLRPRVASEWADESGQWTIGSDSTIRGENAVELISPILRGLPDVWAVKAVVECLNKYGFKVNDSCAFHVHWDISDFSGFQVQYLLKFYARFEPVIDLLMDKSRRGNENTHCRSLVKERGFDWIDKLSPLNYPKAYEIADTFQRTQKLDPVTSFPSARHHKVNPVAILKYGTIEFRQHQGTLDFQEMYNWILLTQQMINKVKSLTEFGTGEVSLGVFNKTLGLTDSQLYPHRSFATEYGGHKELKEMREFYKRKYRRNTKNAASE